MSDSRRPHPVMINRLAIDILADAAKQADAEPIKRTLAHRLALAWLVHNRVAESWQADKFWRDLGTPNAYMGAGAEAQYCRTRDFTICLEAWELEAGLPQT